MKNNHAGAETVNVLLHGPILPTLIRLALPTVAVLFMTTVLSVAETYFVSSLGMDAIAAASLVVPVMMLMTMVSNGGIGGGVSSAIARARGAGLHDDAESLAWHAVVIAIVAGAVFTLADLLGARALYSALGGSGHSLDQAVLYSNILFGGAILFWIVMLLQSALRGAGNVKVPAAIVLGGVVAGLVLSPVLITGWFGLPRMGVAGAGVAQVLCNAGSLVVIVAYMRSARSSLRLRRWPLRRDHFRAILGIGLLSTVNAVMSTLSITALTAAAGAFGVAAIAGYGIASRLDMLLVPVMFGFGTAAITMVGMSLGAGDVTRARRAALLNALFVAALLEVVGLVVALVPNLWLGLFTTDPEVLGVGAHYLRVVAPLYGFIAITSELYFAGQAARRIGWPMAAGAIRFFCAVVAAVWVFVGHASLGAAFVLVAAGVLASGAISLFGFWRVRWGDARPAGRSADSVGLPVTARGATS
jgi:putative MATE family efflux protein